MTSDYNAGSSKHVQSFDIIQKEDFTNRLTDVPKTQGLKDKLENTSEKEAGTILKDKVEAKDKTVIPVIKQEEVEPEKDKDNGDNVDEEKETKYEAMKKEEVPSLNTVEKNKSPSSNEVQTKVESKNEVKTEDKKDANDFSFLDWKEGIATLPGKENFYFWGGGEGRKCVCISFLKGNDSLLSLDVISCLVRLECSSAAGFQ